MSIKRDFPFLFYVPHFGLIEYYFNLVTIVFGPGSPDPPEIRAFQKILTDGIFRFQNNYSHILLLLQTVSGEKIFQWLVEIEPILNNVGK